MTELVIQGFRGRLIGPPDKDYDEARALYNGMIDKRPRLIARCTSAADVMAAVNYAREHKLLLAIRGGGHNGPGFGSCDDGLVIDLSQMRSVRVDPATRTARVDPGCTAADLDHATHAFGLAVPLGIVGSTGVAGLTLGGGTGYLTRKHGLTVDNLLEVDMVLADGSFVTASKDSHPDLFWAVRGGGGNFGVVTTFEYRLHPVSTMYGGMLVYPVARAREVLRLYRDLAAKAPDELTMFAGLMSAPDGTPIVAVLVGYNGPASAGEAAIKPLRDLGPVADQVSTLPYPALNSMLDEGFPHGLHVYWRSDFLKALPDEAIDTLCERFSSVTSPLSALLIEQFGGAVARVPAADSAFAQRDALFNLAVIARWTDPATAGSHVDWARRSSEAMRPFASGGVYVNYLGDEGEERIRAAYGAEKYAKLVAIKKQYDPTNLFRLNQNIKPS